MKTHKTRISNRINLASDAAKALYLWGNNAPGILREQLAMIEDPEVIESKFYSWIKPSRLRRIIEVLEQGRPLRPRWVSWRGTFASTYSHGGPNL